MWCMHLQLFAQALVKNGYATTPNEREKCLRMRSFGKDLAALAGCGKNAPLHQGRI
jgi:hypothetical protein